MKKRKVSVALFTLLLNCLFLIGACLASDGCRHHSSSQRMAGEIHSTLDPSEMSNWAAVPLRLSKPEELNTIQFLSDSHGWITSQAGSLYETKDGGNTWQPVEFKGLPNGRIVSSSFLTDSVGWAVERTSEQTDLLNTTDGGQHWQVQYSSKSAQVDTVHFFNDKEGWAVGGIVVEDYVRKRPSPIIHTTDQGKHWTEVTDNLKAPNPDANITNLSAIAPSRAILLTAEGKVLRTENDGRSWSQVWVVQDEPPQTYFGELGELTDNTLWVLGGADSTEGLWGTLALVNADGTWNKVIIDAYLSDALFVSKDEVLACGHTRSDDVMRRTTVGLILRSTDRGRTWRTLHRTEGVSIKAMSVVSPKLIYAIVSNGSIIRLSSSE